jgi:hypothetical protein
MKLGSAARSAPWRLHQDDPVLLHVELVGGGGGQRVNVDDAGRRHTNELEIAGAEATTAADEPDSTTFRRCRGG